jgi:hypothetical protein
VRQLKSRIKKKLKEFRVDTFNKMMKKIETNRRKWSFLHFMTDETFLAQQIDSNIFTSYFLLSRFRRYHPCAGARLFFSYPCSGDRLILSFPCAGTTLFFRFLVQEARPIFFKSIVKVLSCWYRVILNDCSRSRPCPCYYVFAAFM